MGTVIHDSGSGSGSGDGSGSGYGDGCFTAATATAPTCQETGGSGCFAIRYVGVDGLGRGRGRVLNGLDLFSGIGGIASALSPWVIPRAYCEIDRYAQAVLLSRMANLELPIAPIWNDVRTLSRGMLPAIDIIVGGFPCQDISIAGYGGGLGGERSKLFFEVARLVREIRPSYVFLENVAAVAFRGLDRITAEFSALGYDCRWDMLRACDVGAPHERERWWLLAHANCPGLSQPGSLPQPASIGQASAVAALERGFQGEVWLPATSELCRIPDGIRPATHRIRALGNAVVPRCAREAFKRLMGL